MNVTGIIAEYNPFHLGHLYQINYIKESLKADYIIAAMSGDYVQRGTPALLPKHIRAEMALRCGVDLVLELPVQFSSASAEAFARGGVSLLNGLGVVNQLCFGSEEGSVDDMLRTARILNEEPLQYRTLLQESLKEGMSFPAARSRALKEYLLLQEKNSPPLPDSLLSSPNNILGIEYCRAILSLRADIEPVTLKRRGAGYHETALLEEQAPSASAVRAHLKNHSSAILHSSEENTGEAIFSALDDQLPPPALKLLREAVFTHGFLTEGDLDLLLHYCLISEMPEHLHRYADVSSDLADRILNQLNHYQGFSQFADLLKTRELTRTRIQRALLHILLHMTEAPGELPYGRVLGFRRSAAPLLKEIKKKGQIPLLTKLADAPRLISPEGLKIMEFNTRSSNIYESILCRKTGSAFRHEYQKQIVII